MCHIVDEHTIKNDNLAIMNNKNSSIYHHFILGKRTVADVSYTVTIMLNTLPEKWTKL